jgi:hypothetical protein
LTQGLVHHVCTIIYEKNIWIDSYVYYSVD